MAIPDSNEPVELEALKAGMQNQLDAKSSLFDLLSPPPAPQPSAAESERSQTGAVIRLGRNFAFAIILLTTAIALAGLFSGSRDFSGLALSGMSFAGLIGGLSFRTHSLLHKRIGDLETELRELREKLSR